MNLDLHVSLLIPDDNCKVISKIMLKMQLFILFQFQMTTSVMTMITSYIKHELVSELT